MWNTFVRGFGWIVLRWKLLRSFVAIGRRSLRRALACAFTPRRPFARQPTGTGPPDLRHRCRWHRERPVNLRKLLTTEEITELNPPRTWEVRGVGGIPVTTIAKGTIEGLDGSDRSLLTISLKFEGHGIGKQLAALIRSQSRKQLPGKEERLKDLLERSQ
jgi:hypothetical protein